MKSLIRIFLLFFIIVACGDQGKAVNFLLYAQTAAENDSVQGAGPEGEAGGQQGMASQPDDPSGSMVGGPVSEVEAAPNSAQEMSQGTDMDAYEDTEDAGQTGSGYTNEELSADYYEGPGITLTEEEIEDNVLIQENRISLDLKGIDILELFKIVSKKMGVTIVPSRNVRGRISVFLNNLTLEDALDVIILSQDMAYSKEGDLVNVVTSSEYEKKYGRKFDEKKKIRTLKLNYAKPSNVSNVIVSLKSEVGKIIVDESSGTMILIDTPEALAIMENAVSELDQPLETTIFDVNYARSADIKTYLNELITPGLGHIIIDERSSKAIVTDLPQRVEKIKRLLKELDESSRQVLITGQIIQVSLDDTFQQGIEWDRLLTENKWHDLDLVGNFPGGTDLSSYQKINVGTLSSDDYTALIKMLQTYGKVKILSSPQIVAVDRVEAKILVGSREAFISQTLSQAQSSTEIAENVEFVDVGVKLNVMPTIGKDGFITIKVKPEVSSVRETITTSRGSQIPIIETSEAESVVKVKDGSMVMIAGLIKEDLRDTINGVPVLSKIPFLGRLFSNRDVEKTKSELIIFLTPRLISGDNNAPLQAKGANEG